MKDQKGAKGGQRSGSALFFYIAAVVFLLMGVFFCVEAVKYLQSYAEQSGTSLSSMKADVFQYVLGQVAPYLGYAVAAFGIGKILSAAAGLKGQLQGQGASSEEELMPAVQIQMEQAEEEESEEGSEGSDEAEAVTMKAGDLAAEESEADAGETLAAGDETGAEEDSAFAPEAAEVTDPEA